MWKCFLDIAVNSNNIVLSLLSFLNSFTFTLKIQMSQPFRYKKYPYLSFFYENFYNINIMA